MMTFIQFKEKFDDEVRSEVNSDYFMGFFFILIGVALSALIELNVIKSSGTKAFYYTGFLLIVILGFTVLYWIKIRYKISVFYKNCTDDQIEKGIEKIREKYKMDILKCEGTFYTLFYRPGSSTPWTEVNLFYDSNRIYINVRTKSKGNIDFGFGKVLERKLVKEIKTSH